jgi:hypothetical protein
MHLHRFEHVGSYAFAQRPVVIDFDLLPTIVCLFGRNEQGKTVTLDMIWAALFLEMPYYAGALVDNFVTSGYIRLVWSLPEQPELRYTSNVLVDVKLGKVEATLHENNGPAIAGPLQKDYLKAITLRLGSLDVLRCTAYSVQQSRTNAKTAWSFLTATRAERRAVMAELLGLDRYARHEAAAKSRNVALEREVEGKRTEIGVLRAQAAVLPGLRKSQEVAFAVAQQARSDLSSAKQQAKSAAEALGRCGLLSQQEAPQGAPV